MEQSRSFGFETRQVHAGQRPDPNTGARAVPIYQTTSYVFEDPESAAAYFNLQEYGNTYSRIMNPTVAVFEERMASLEGGCGAVAFASGIAAQAAALFTLLSPGDHVVASSALYGGTVNQFKHMLRKMSVELTWVDPDDLAAWRGAVRGNTKAFYGETIGNPGGNVLDIEGVAAIAHEHGIPLIVDNTFATPYLQNPLSLGADVVHHSSTKYLGGHSDVVGGVLVMNDEALAARVKFLQNAVGAVPSPFDCFMLLRSTKTLHVRMERHCQNAMEVARWLSKHPKMEKVIYPGLESHPQHALARRQMRAFGGMITGVLKGGLDGARRFLERVELFSLAESLGGVESLIEHPAIMTHASIPPETRRQIGIADGLVRLSVGIEEVGDLIKDLERALG